MDQCRTDESSSSEERIVLDDATEKQLDALSEVQLGTFINKALQEGTTIGTIQPHNIKPGGCY